MNSNNSNKIYHAQAGESSDAPGNNRRVPMAQGEDALYRTPRLSYSKRIGRDKFQRDARAGLATATPSGTLANAVVGRELLRAPPSRSGRLRVV